MADFVAANALSIHHSPPRGPFDKKRGFKYDSFE